MVTEDDIKNAQNERQLSSVKRATAIDTIREWGIACAGAVAIPLGVSEWFIPELLPIVLPEPMTGFGLFSAGVAMLYGPKVVTKTIKFAKQLDE